LRLGLDKKVFFWHTCLFFYNMKTALISSPIYVGGLIGAVTSTTPTARKETPMIFVVFRTSTDSKEEKDQRGEIVSLERSCGCNGRSHVDEIDRVFTKDNAIVYAEPVAHEDKGACDGTCAIGMADDAIDRGQFLFPVPISAATVTR